MSIREDLKAYLDGELPEARSEEIRAALAADPALQKEAQFMTVLGDSIRSTANQPEIEGAEATLQAVRAGKGRRRLLSLRTAWLSLSAVAVFVVCALFFPIFAQPKMAAKSVGDDTLVASAPHFDQSIANGAADELNKAESPSIAGMSASPAPQADRRTLPGKLSAEPALPVPDRGRARQIAVGSAKKPASEASRVDVGPALHARTRSVIQNAEETIQVSDARKAQNVATSIATSAGGYVENSGLSTEANNVPTATITIRVPVERFTQVLNQIRSLGKVEQDHVTGEDVTGQVADVGARLKVLSAEEVSYTEMLRTARRVTDSLEIRDRLSDVRQQIESLQAQQATLKDQSAMSTLNLTFEQAPPPKPTSNQEQSWSKETWSGAWNGVSGAMRSLTAGFIYVIVYIPIWAPLLVAAWWLVKKGKSSF